MIARGWIASWAFQYNSGYSVYYKAGKEGMELEEDDQNGETISCIDSQLVAGAPELHETPSNNI